MKPLLLILALAPPIAAQEWRSVKTQRVDTGQVILLQQQMATLQRQLIDQQKAMERMAKEIVRLREWKSKPGERGPVGPQGPQGERGPAGRDGPGETIDEQSLVTNAVDAIKALPAWAWLKEVPDLKQRLRAEEEKKITLRIENQGKLIGESVGLRMVGFDVSELQPQSGE